MREIGRLADVSQSTVSLILNGKSEMVRICPETRDKVLTIAREHGYAPNLLARAMRTGDTGVIGILVSREAMRQIADNHGAVRGTLQLQAGFLLRDHRVMLEVVGEEDCRELRLPRTLSTGLVDTFILCESFLLKEAMKRYIEALRKQARCVIVVDEWLDGIIPTVKVDDEAAGRLAAEHLWGLGHRRFGIVTCEERREVLSCRMAAFEGRLAELGGSRVSVVRSYGGDRWSLDCGGVAVRVLFASDAMRPTAILGANDFFAVGAERELLRLGLRVPEDVSVIGIGEWEQAASAPVPITTVSVDMAEKVEAIIRIWKAHLAGQASAPNVTLLSGHLVLRGSTGRPSEV